MIKRKTVQRSLVLEAVNKLKCHATAEEVCAEITQRYPNISRGTVYRNLKQLAECGEIRKIEVPRGAERFDHQSHDHYHVLCDLCGRVYDVDMAYIEDLQKSIKNTHGFKFRGHDIMFRGICPNCAVKEEAIGQSAAERK